MTIHELKDVIRCALGRVPADLVIKNVTVVNVFTEELVEGSIALKGKYIARVGEVNDIISDSTIIYDAKGMYAVPAFIDAHIHIESAMITLTEFARAVIPHGTGTIITDIHELANVIGIEAVDLILREAEKLPLNVFIMLPSCVPAAPGIDTSGAEIGVGEIQEYIEREYVLGLGEMMNYPGVLNLEEDVLKKIGIAQNAGKVVDGHAPLLLGKELQAYASVGILTDHETVTPEEALEKLRSGMYLLVREGSLSKNIDILRKVIERGLSLERCIIVTDDRHPDDLLREGHLDPAIRKAIKMGIDPVKAIKMVTLIPAQAYRLSRIGGIAPGYYADIVLLKNLESVSICKVFLKGELVADDGKVLIKLQTPQYPAKYLRTINVKKTPTKDDLAIISPEDAEEVAVRVIGVQEGSLITKSLTERLAVKNRRVLPDPSRDILEIVVVERHRKTGNIGKGFVKGFGIKRGALASTIAHDSHNIVAVGADLDSLETAIKEVIRIGGGLVVALRDKVLAELSLPLAGLMSIESIENVVQKLDLLNNKAKELGIKIRNPFMTLSFLALPVIPELKITDKGLFDVKLFKRVNVIIQ
ncbi:MAG: adenine deaminase [Candidatus Njordarchaeales archaeon]